MNDLSSMSSPPTLRASDAEREHTAEHLQQHFAEGRLKYDELQERLEEAYAARTVGELTQLVADLPASTTVSAAEPEVPATDRRSRDHHGRTPVQALVSYVMICLFLIAIWAASGHHGSFWPIWPIIAFGFIFAARISKSIGR